MCIICGKIEHQTFELLEKALTKNTIKKKELPRYKALADLEADFKKQFAECLINMSEEILDSVK